MHTPDLYYGTGSMIDAAEIPVKQYNAMGGSGGSNTTGSNQNRPMNTSHRRSSSGVYDDEGLASAAAMAALYKQDLDTAGQNSMNVNSPQAGNLSKESGAEERNDQNGNGMSSPRQRLNGKLHIETSLGHQGRFILTTAQSMARSKRYLLMPAVFISQRHFVDSHSNRRITNLLQDRIFRFIADL